MLYFFGVMSKNQVDTVIQYSLDNPEKCVYFIPSRRQIEYNGGYVNNWTTKDFSNYVKSYNSNIKIERDHSGPGQGLYEDDGYMSLEEDCKYFDIIHIDPWKKYQKLEDGIQWTIDMINFCYSKNPNIEYEIGTEEAIRSYTTCELIELISVLRSKLTGEVFNKIKYCVVQCGNNLCNGDNTNKNFDKCKLKDMIKLCNENHFISKEHNGDWISNEVVREKEMLGLRAINIAPEFGTLETSIILKNIKLNNNHYDTIFKLCIESGKWKKWVAADFDVNFNKDKLILITCHYIFSNPEFKKIKAHYPNIDNEINKALNYKLMLLKNIFEERNKCIFCNNTNLETMFNNDYDTTLSLCMLNNKCNNYFMPYNILICNNCNSVQNKYVGDLSIVYKVNHMDNYGTTKTLKHDMFSKFITRNKEIKGIVEIGACSNALSSNITDMINIDYHIIEPAFTGDRTGLNIIEKYIENVNLNDICANCIIMSDVFEHFYNPTVILNKLQNSSIEYIYLNHPDFEYSIDNNIHIILNCEHTFVIEHDFLFKLFENYGFHLNRRFDFENQSLFLEFKKSVHIANNILKNVMLPNKIKTFMDNTILNVKIINNYIEMNPNKQIYIWPVSMHTIPLFTMGLNYKKLSGMLDNSPNKIGKYLYGYQLLCSSLNDILETGSSNITIFISKSGNYIKEINTHNTSVKLIYLC